MRNMHICTTLWFNLCFFVALLPWRGMTAATPFRRHCLACCCYCCCRVLMRLLLSVFVRVHMLCCSCCSHSAGQFAVCQIFFGTARTIATYSRLSLSQCCYVVAARIITVSCCKLFVAASILYILLLLLLLLLSSPRLVRVSEAAEHVDEFSISI